MVAGNAIVIMAKPWRLIIRFRHMAKVLPAKAKVHSAKAKERSAKAKVAKEHSAKAKVAEDPRGCCSAPVWRPLAACSLTWHAAGLPHPLKAACSPFDSAALTDVVTTQCLKDCHICMLAARRFNSVVRATSAWGAEADNFFNRTALKPTDQSVSLFQLTILH
eukprot:1157617-Pelagomonas_calceolata.AAC.3